MSLILGGSKAVEQRLLLTGLVPSVEAERVVRGYCWKMVDVWFNDRNRFKLVSLFAPSSSNSESMDYAQEISALLAELAGQPDREPIASELEGKPQHLDSMQSKHS